MLANTFVTICPVSNQSEPRGKYIFCMNKNTHATIQL